MKNIIYVIFISIILSSCNKNENSKVDNVQYEIDSISIEDGFFNENYVLRKNDTSYFQETIIKKVDTTLVYNIDASLPYDFAKEYRFINDYLYTQSMQTLGSQTTTYDSLYFTRNTDNSINKIYNRKSVDMPYSPTCPYGFNETVYNIAYENKNIKSITYENRNTFPSDDPFCIDFYPDSIFYDNPIIVYSNFDNNYNQIGLDVNDLILSHFLNFSKPYFLNACIFNLSKKINTPSSKLISEIPLRNYSFSEVTQGKISYTFDSNFNNRIKDFTINFDIYGNQTYIKYKLYYK
ncbi:MAG: hypothetical protein IPK18_03000 [Sphingobacteriales bacterium]|nr:MAG: hypothetical protein IPK18_03000 [Sphingobacteriales bacterium]